MPSQKLRSEQKSVPGLPVLTQGGGGVCWQNISYHVAAFVIPFKLICNIKLF